MEVPAPTGGWRREGHAVFPTLIATFQRSLVGATAMSSAAPRRGLGAHPDAASKGMASLV
jgi:hypothetical protein